MENIEWRERVRAEADGAARMFLHGEDEGQPISREQKEVIEGILAPDYDGRTVIELLQNGHDAHDRHRSDGCLELFLDEDEGDHGVLYVANGGNPITDENFTAMCRIAMSTKPPQEGIGNKGVGFKSVLQLTESPEVYSKSVSGATEFDGYCFRFAKDEDFDVIAGRVAPERPGLAEDLRANVANLKLPVVLEDAPAGLSRFDRAEVATVLRVVLRSESARERVVEQFAVLTDSEVPVHLFLERVASISVRISGEDPLDLRLERREIERSRLGDAVVKRVEIQDGSRFLVLERPVAEASVKEAIAAGRTDTRLGSAWDAWEGDAWVSIALPVDHPLERGRLYTFLPMAASAEAPIAAFVNAPFFARLDRRHLEAAIPLNDLLLNHVALLAADVLVRSASGEIQVPRGALVDLACWQAQAQSRLTGALRLLGTSIAAVPCIPVLGREEPAPLDEVTLWRTAASVFNPTALAMAGEDRIVDPALAEPRRQRIIQLARSVGLQIDASVEVRAELAERLAAHLAGSGADASVWVDFYDDLAGEQGLGAVLAGRRILIGANGALFPCGGHRNAEPVVFIPPSGADDEDAPPSVEVPEAVTHRMVFMWPALHWVTEARQQRRGRAWLVNNRLARPYQTAPVLAAVGDVMAGTDAGDDETLRACLQFALEVWMSRSRDVGADVMTRSALLVPTGHGWIAAGEALFGPGWPGPRSDVDRRLSDLVGRASSVSSALSAIGRRTVPSPVALGVEGRPEKLRTFLELIGVRHGLVPTLVPLHSRLNGAQVKSPGAWHRAPSGITEQQWKALLTVAAAQPRSGPAFDTVEYRPQRESIHGLPGLESWDQFDPSVRRLYVELLFLGLDEWEDEVLTMRWTRPVSDPTGATWPSLISSFLATAAWFPQTAPGNRSDISFHALDEAWWHREETRRYLPAQPPWLRSLATDKVLNRLRSLGLRVWEDQSTASARLATVVELVAQSARVAGPPPSVANEAELAWRDLIASQPDRLPSRILVRTQGVLHVEDLDEEGPAVYADDPAATEVTQLLRQTPAKVLAVRRPHLAAKIHAGFAAQDVPRMRSARDLTWEVQADGRAAGDAPAVPLVEAVGPWFALLVLGATAFDERDRPPESATRLAEDQRLLSGAKVVLASGVVVWLDGFEVDRSGAAPSLIVETGDGQRVIVEADDSGDPYRLAASMAPAISQLLGGRFDQQRLRLAFYELEHRCKDSVPTMRDIAAALGVPEVELQAHVQELQGGWQVDLDTAAVVAFADVTTAEKLLDASPFDDEPGMIDWLDDHLPAGCPAPSRLLELARAGDLLAATHELGLTLIEANAALRAVGHAPMHNPHGHRRQLEHVKQLHASDFENKIRDRFVSVAQAGEPLEAYVQVLREIADIQPDPTWLDQWWEVPPDELVALIDRWIDDRCPAAPTDAVLLPAVSELREAGRRTISSVIGNVPSLVAAWLSQHPDVPEVHVPPAPTVTLQMTSEGTLDFGPVTAGEIVQWLSRQGYWPLGMPLSTSRTELGLSAADVEAAKSALREGKEVARKAKDSVEYDERRYGSEAEDRQALAAAIVAALEREPEVLDTPPDPLDLAHSASSSGADRGQNHDRGGGGRYQGPPPEKTAGVGFIGEVIVGRWIEEQFHLPPEATWRSGYREDVLADGRGDDSLGYDFQVELPDRTLLIEVKATTDDRLQFNLGESEVDRASHLAPHEEYLIALVTNAKDPQRHQILPLPNPFGPDGLRKYRIVGQNLRLQFTPRAPV